MIDPTKDDAYGPVIILRRAAYLREYCLLKPRRYGWANRMASVFDAIRYVPIGRIDPRQLQRSVHARSRFNPLAAGLNPLASITDHLIKLLGSARPLPRSLRWADAESGPLPKDAFESPAERTLSILCAEEVRENLIQHEMEVSGWNIPFCPCGCWGHLGTSYHATSAQFRESLQRATPELVWNGGLSAPWIESEQLIAWWAEVSSATKRHHARDIARERKQWPGSHLIVDTRDTAVTKANKYKLGVNWGLEVAANKLLRKFDLGIRRGEKKVESLDEFLKNTKIVYLEQHEGRSITMNGKVDGTPVALVEDANVAETNRIRRLHGGPPSPETPTINEEHYEPKDVLALFGKDKSDALLMLVLLKELWNANRVDDTMSDAKLAAHIRKQAAHSKWPGPVETPDLLRQRTMKRIRKITTKQLRTHRAYFQSIHALPVSL